MVDKEVIDYWIDTIDSDLELRNYIAIKDAFYANKDGIEIFTYAETGIFAYTITNTFSGNKTLVELIFYLYPSYRGNLNLVRKYLSKVERVAKEKGCTKVAIGANIGYNDEGFAKLLQRFGYSIDTLTKEV